VTVLFLGLLLSSKQDNVEMPTTDLDSLNKCQVQLTWFVLLLSSLYSLIMDFTTVCSQLSLLPMSFPEE
jgi:hypothetical protein